MVGFGYDVHRLAHNESLILGGIEIDSTLGTIAHSDGDVLWHAVMDALLGAAGLGDIGEHFPDTDMKYKNADSSKMALEVIAMLNNLSLKIVNLDIMIMLETPKLKKYKQAIKSSVAKICEITEGRVNIKAGTNEKMGFIGRSEGIAVYCVCLLEKSE